MGWTANLDSGEYACWIKLLQAVKSYGKRGGKISRGSLTPETLERMRLLAVDWALMLAKGIEAGAIKTDDKDITICNWGVYQDDPTNSERQKRWRDKQEVTGNNVTPVTNRYVTDITPTGTGRGRDGDKEELREQSPFSDISDPTNPDYVANPIDIARATKHITQCFGTARLEDTTIGPLHPDVRRKQVEKAIVKEGTGKKGVQSLIQMVPRDFINGWTEFLRVVEDKPKMMWSVTFAVTCMKKRWKKAEDKREVIRKKAINREEAQACDKLKELAMKTAEANKDEFARRDEWWAGLSGEEKQTWFQRHREDFSNAVTNEQTVKAWAWEQRKETGNGKKDD